MGDWGALAWNYDRTAGRRSSPDDHPRDSLSVYDRVPGDLAGPILQIRRGVERSNRWPYRRIEEFSPSTSRPFGPPLDRRGPGVSSPPPQRPLSSLLFVLRHLAGRSPSVRGIPYPAARHSPEQAGAVYVSTEAVRLQRASAREHEMENTLLRAGGAEGDRTPDLLIANEALSQLSYGPAPDPGNPKNRSLCKQARVRVRPFRAGPVPCQ